MIDPADHIDLARRIVGKFTRNWPAGIDRSDIESAAMFALVKAARRQPDLDPEGFKAYASVCIRGAAIDAYNERRRHEDDWSLDAPVADHDAVSFGDTIAGPDDVEADIVKAEQLRWLRCAIATLPTQHRYVVERRLAEVPYSQIAAEMGTGADEPRNMHSYAVIRMRRPYKRGPAGVTLAVAS